jgi:hypothetical protein
MLKIRLADINVLSSVQHMTRWAPDLMNESVSSRTYEWLQMMKARPAVHATLSVSEQASPLLLLDTIPRLQLSGAATRLCRQSPQVPAPAHTARDR